MKRLFATFLTFLATLTPGSVAFADPCGMVPPIYLGTEVPITRIGLQQTYVFHRDGVQTIAIRPGFTGDVQQFGMLVPLPAVPALRKIDDRTFEHLRAAVDPPEVFDDAAGAGTAFDANLRRPRLRP